MLLHVPCFLISVLYVSSIFHIFWLALAAVLGTPKWSNLGHWPLKPLHNPHTTPYTYPLHNPFSIPWYVWIYLGPGTPEAYISAISRNRRISSESYGNDRMPRFVINLLIGSLSMWFPRQFHQGDWRTGNYREYKECMWIIRIYRTIRNIYIYIYIYVWFMGDFIL